MTVGSARPAPAAAAAAAATARPIPWTTSNAPAPRKASCCAMYASGGESDAVLACCEEAKSSEIQPCRISQITFGISSASAISAPYAACGRSRKTRRQEPQQPSAMASSGTKMVYLDSKTRGRPTVQPQPLARVVSHHQARRRQHGHAPWPPDRGTSGWKSTAPPSAYRVRIHAAQPAPGDGHWPSSRAIAPAATAATIASSEDSRRRENSDGPIVPSTSRPGHGRERRKST